MKNSSRMKAIEFFYRYQQNTLIHKLIIRRQNKHSAQNCYEYKLMIRLYRKFILCIYQKVARGLDIHCNARRGLNMAPLRIYVSYSFVLFIYLFILIIIFRR